jgi:hypothetical protein
MKTKFLGKTMGLLMLLSLLGGCLLHVALPQQIPIQTSVDYDAVYSAIGVDANGVKHIVWNECTVSLNEDCKIYYRASIAGEVLDEQDWTPPPGSSYTYPDIAVTDTGIAYITWQEVNSSHENRDRWVRSDTHAASQYVNSTYINVGQSLMVTNGDDVYIVSTVSDGSYTAIRYKKLGSDEPWSEGWVAQPGASLRRDDVSASVNPAGALYVTWAVYDAGNNDLFYADNHDSSGNMTNLWTIVTDSPVQESEIVATSSHIFITYYNYAPTAHPTSDDLHLIYCTGNDCVAGPRTDRILNLPSAKNWIINGVISLDAYGNHAELGFPASNDDIGSYQQVFLATYSVGGVETLTQITDADTHHTNVKLVYIPIGATVLSFFRWTGGSYYDLYEFDNYHNQEYLMGKNLISTIRQDLAYNSSPSEYFIGGSWSAPGKPADTRRAVWFSYNDAVMFLPLIRIP